MNSEQVEGYVNHHLGQTLQTTEEQLTMAARSFAAVAMDLKRALILLGDNRDEDTDEQHDELRKLTSTFQHYAEEFTEHAADIVRIHGILFPDAGTDRRDRREGDGGQSTYL